MSDTHDRWQRWTLRASDIVTCHDENCTPESHTVAIRYLLAEAYDNGYLDAKRDERDEP